MLALIIVVCITAITTLGTNANNDVHRRSAPRSPVRELTAVNAGRRDQFHLLNI